MNKVFSFALAAALMMAAACSEPLNEVAEEATHQNRVDEEQIPQYTFSPEELGYLTELANGTPKISVDSAAKVAMMVMGNGKSLSKRSLSVTAFGTPKSTSLTKSFTDSDIDTTFYVFNAPGDNGFAVISADARIPQQVLAFSETGNLELDSDNPAFDVFLDYTQNYAAHCIAKAQDRRDSIINSIYEKFGITVDLDSANSLSKTKHVIQRFLLTCQCYSYTHVETIAEVKPMLNTNWHQLSPYNDRTGGRDKCKQGYAAGCIPISIAQLMVYWRYPQQIEGTTMNWSMLNNESDSSKPQYKSQAALLVSNIGKKSKTSYGCSISSSNIALALNYLISMKYSSPKTMTGYKYNKVINNLKKGWPVLLGGTRDVASGGSLSMTWLSDGYIHQKKTVSSQLTYVVVEVDDETGRGSCRFEHTSGGCSVTEPEFLHINWGNGPKYNGYYAKDVFDVDIRYKVDNDGVYVRDCSTNTNYNYRRDLRIVDGICR